MRYMRNRNGVVLPYNAELVSRTDMGFTECSVAGHLTGDAVDTDIPILLDEPPAYALVTESAVPEAVTTSPDTFGKRGRPRKLGSE